MSYVIKNDKNTYIKLDEGGKPITCCEHSKMLFDKTKANNILSTIPKTLKRMGFKVEAVPEEKRENDILQNKEYVISENIYRWIDKFGVCEDVFEEAKERRVFLRKEESNLDKELTDIIHIIELSKRKDMYSYWLLTKRIKENREKYRQVTDELTILTNILDRTVHSALKRESVRKSVNGLVNRKYQFRIVDDTIRSLA